MRTGLVVKAHSGFFTVLVEGGDRVTCQAAGKLTRGKHTEDLLAVGDQAEFSDIEGDGFVRGRIERVVPRKSSLSRRDPVANTSRKDVREIRQVIVANVDLVVFVFACAEPDFHARMLDRFIVGAEAQKLPTLICATKTDLVRLIARTQLEAARMALEHNQLQIEQQRARVEAAMRIRCCVSSYRGTCRKVSASGMRVQGVSHDGQSASRPNFHASRTNGMVSM